MSLELLLEDLSARRWQAQPLSEPVPIEELPTPALLLDRRRFDANVAKMAEFLAAKQIGVRPHGKTHKCPLIALEQMRAGAVGICVAKPSEAFVFAQAGLPAILITSPISTPDKARLVARTLEHCDGLSIVVDSLASLRLLAECVPEERELGIVVDVDVAMGRTGTREFATVCALAEAATAHDRLRFVGVQHYAGHLMHLEGLAQRREASNQLWETVASWCDDLAARGMSPEIVTGGGTGTYNIDCEQACITDLQVGSYVLMDQEYRLIGGADGELFDDFEVAMTVLATGISAPLAGRAFTVDAGYKSFASDSVNPEPLNLPDTKFRFGGDEHGIVVLPKSGSGSNALVGAAHHFIAPHCDPTVNLHDNFWVHDGEHAYERWPIAARGCAW